MLYIIFFLLEKINIVVWLVMGATALLFFDSPGGGLSDLWYFPTIIIILTFILIGSIWLASHSERSMNAWIVLGFIISMLLSYPSVTFLAKKHEDNQKAKTVLSFIEKHNKENTPLSNSEIIEYFEYLKKSKGSVHDIEEFETLLNKNIINPYGTVDHDGNSVSILSQIVSLPKSIFLETLLKHAPTINDNAFLVYYLSTFYKENQTETLKKAKLLLEHGFDPSKKDYVYKNEEPKSAIDLLKKTKATREELVADGEARKIEFAQDKGKDPSQIDDFPDLAQFKKELENVNRLIDFLENYR